MKRAILEGGPKARLYLTSTDFFCADAEVLRVPHISLAQEGSDIMMQRLLADEFVLEDVLFMSALKVARVVAESRGCAQRVYMVGFDFRPELGQSLALGRTFETDAAETRRFRIGMQENFFLNALYMLRDSQIDVVHVGERPYSRITPGALTDEFLPSSNPGRRKWNVSIVAELTTNHFGDRGRLERMVRAARAAGADYIKVQKRDVDSFYTKEQLASKYRSPFGETFADYRHQLELDRDDFEHLNKICKSLGIEWFASALDEPSYHFLMEHDPCMVKLPSTISNHKDYLSMVALKCDRPIVLSTGMTDRTYEDWVLNAFSRSPTLYLLQCNSAYPTPAEDCNIGVVRHYSRLSHTNKRIVPGYSSHDTGWFGSALAVAAGALMVEKHVKLGNTDWAHFDAVALDMTTAEFKEYVAKVRDAELVVGSEEKEIQASEHHKY